MTALGLEQYDALVTYLERFEQLRPGEPWAPYYRALGLLELGRPGEALEAVEEEARRSGGSALHLDILRAAGMSALGRSDEFRSYLRRVLDVRLAGEEHLTQAGLQRLFERLWRAANILPAEDPLRLELEELLLQTGLAPDDYFDAPRQHGAEAPGVNFYRCLVRQPLDERWRHGRGCLAGEEGWQSYRIVWGVLARDEDEASERVLQWQRRCYPLESHVEHIALEQEGFTDRPGVVWQGAREGADDDDSSDAD
jgi:hypothetical protein